MPPTVVVLVGIPGSGKTTLVQQLHSISPAWEWINQDTLGDRRVCEQALQQALQQGRNAIIDRCNSTDRQRSAWLNLAREVCNNRVHTIAVQLLLPLEQCVQRVQQREGHPTLAPHMAREVCSRFFSEFETVRPQEGFAEVLTVRHPEEMKAMVQHLRRRAEREASMARPQVGPPAVGPQSLPQGTGAEGMKPGSVEELGGAKRGRWDQTDRVQGATQPLSHAPPGHGQQQSGSRARAAAVWQQQQQQQQHTWQQAHWLPTPEQHMHVHLQAAYQGVGVMAASSGGGGPWQLQGGHGPPVVGYLPFPMQLGPAPAWAAPQHHHPGAHEHDQAADGAPAAWKPERHAPGGSRGGRARGGKGGEGNAVVVAQLAQLFADPRSKVPYDEVPITEATAAAAAAAGPEAADQPTSAGEGDQSLPGHAQEQQDEGLQEAQAQAQSDAASTAPDPDPRVILLFDLNGTLTSHTSVRYSSGTNRARPNVKLLLRLKPLFRLGIFTSATVRTVSAARELLEGAAGVEAGGLFEPRLILYRDHTCPAPAHLQAAKSKSWETVKPLNKWFKRLHRVVLFDDDLHKAFPGEEGNLVHMQRWDDSDDTDQVLEQLVEALLTVLGPLGVEEDVRGHTAAITQQLAERAAALQAQRAGGSASGEGEEAVGADSAAVHEGAEAGPGGAQDPEPGCLHSCLTDAVTVLKVDAADP